AGSFGCGRCAREVSARRGANMAGGDPSILAPRLRPRPGIIRVRVLPVVLRKRFSVIRDPVHGDVYLTHEEISILDTPEMQRLRGVKQLGTAYLVFPGAVHTRFDHSIGSLHMAARIIEAVNRSLELDPKTC